MDLLQEAIAYFPLVVLISGVLASLGVKPLTKKLGSKVCQRVGVKIRTFMALLEQV